MLSVNQLCEATAKVFCALCAGGRRLASYINASDPSSEIAGEAAAALAATALAFASTDPAYGGLALAHAVELFMFGTTYLGSYMTSQSPGAHVLCGRAVLHLRHAALS